MFNKFDSARRRGVPIVSITSADFSADIKAIMAKLKDVPMVSWDVIRGVIPINDAGGAAASLVNDDDPDSAAMLTANPVEALDRLNRLLPDGAIAFLYNAHLFISGQEESRKAVIQGVWNCRNSFKSTKRMLVLMSPSLPIPPELSNDIISIDVPLPDADALKAIAKGLFKSAKIEKLLTEETLAQIVDATIGLSAFSAEQIIAMSLSPEGVDLKSLWEMKKGVIEQTDGLKVLDTDITFDRLKGQDALQSYLKMIANGKNKPRVVLFLDEIEKSVTAGSMGDTSGVSQDQIKVLLTSMQDYEWTGIILVGYSGTGKSAVAKAMCNESSAKGIEADLGAMKGQYVGNSERMMRAFVKTIKAMAETKVLIIATSNNISALSPELKRRFSKGIFFCDLPDMDSLKSIGEVYIKRYELDASQETPWTEGWSGAEIEVCCRNAWEFDISLKEASQYVTIASKSMGKAVDDLRKDASGKFLDARSGGVYYHSKNKPESGERAMALS